MKKAATAKPASEQEANRAVERALYMRAVGYVQQEEKTVYEDDGKGGGKEKREVTYKQAAPDLNAILAWLRDRAPERWNGGGTDPIVRVVTETPRPPEEAENGCEP